MGKVAFLRDDATRKLELEECLEVKVA